MDVKRDHLLVRLLTLAERAEESDTAKLRDDIWKLRDAMNTAGGPGSAGEKHFKTVEKAIYDVCSATERGEPRGPSVAKLRLAIEAAKQSIGA
jgi:hypothetical protein